MLDVDCGSQHPTSQVLASLQTLLAPGGTVLVLEFHAPPSFPDLMGPAASPEQRGLSTFCYSASTLHCLPVSKVAEKKPYFLLIF